LPPTEAEQIAALTGGNPQDFVKTVYGYGSQNSCTVLLRVVKASTMGPITGGFQVGVDLNLATELTPSNTIRLSKEGLACFAGGGLHEVTSQIRDGVLRIDKTHAQFDLETAFGSAGSSAALTCKQCFGAQKVLLYVIENPAKISDGGEWLWVKSGKEATDTEKGAGRFELHPAAPQCPETGLRKSYLADLRLSAILRASARVSHR
jgi:hypothetical protein